MAEALTTLTRLLVVREIQEGESGATLRFQQGSHGHLTLGDANYPTHLRLARRSQERQHPVGVSFSEGHAITELVRADNDVPTELWDENPDRSHVLFQGHDGVFHIKSDYPEFARLRAVLCEALREKTPVWFVVHKPDLALLDVLPTWSHSPTGPVAQHEESCAKVHVTPVLDGRAWLGKAGFYATWFLVELFESRKHPGYYHYATYCKDDSFCDESKQPMKSDFLQSHLDLLLKGHNLLVGELNWCEVVATELPLLGERASAGE